jgi:hypothetical protein
MSEVQVPAATKARTKKVRIYLAGLTRVEYSEILEVPAGMTTEQLNELVEQRYEDVDGGDYRDDPDSWDQGECHFEKESPDAQIDGVVTKVRGEFKVRMLPAAPGPAPATFPATERDRLRELLRTALRALDDASGVVDPGEGEEHAYQAELAAIREELGD